MGTVLAISQSSALLLLFVVLPVVLAPIVIAYVDRHSPAAKEGERTSDLLRDGEETRAELIRWRLLTTFLFDPRPMVEFELRFEDGHELTTTQAVPRPLVGDIRTGMEMIVSVNADRSAGAVVLDFGDELDLGDDPEDES